MGHTFAAGVRHNDIILNSHSTKILQKNFAMLAQDGAYGAFPFST